MTFSQIWWLALLIKIVVGTFVPPISDEMYYWVWSHDLQMSYFDHPPMVAGVLALGHLFENFFHAMRIPGIILAHCSILFWRPMLSEIFDDCTMKLWLLVVIFSPIVGLGSLLITPDIPLIFFWSASVFAFWKCIQSQSSRWYFLLGALMGLGFCSKYNMALFIPCVFSYLAAERIWKRVKLRFVAASIGAGLIFCLPVILWNYQHDFDSFAFQLKHGLGEQTLKAKWLFSYLGEQVGIIFPTFVIGAVVASKKMGLVRARGDDETDQSTSVGRLLIYFGWIPFLVFMLSSLKGRVEANWPLVGYPAILALGIHGFKKFKWPVVTLAVWVLVIVIVVTQAIFRWIPDHSRKLKTSEYFAYDAIVSLAREHSPLYANSFQMAATLSYKLRRPFYKLNGINRRDYYDYVSESFPTEDRFFLVARYYDSFPQWLNEKYLRVNEVKVDDALHMYEYRRR